MNNISSSTSNYIAPFSSIKNSDISIVGGKNASLGEMYNSLAHFGIRVPDGFAITTAAFDEFIEHNDLHDRLLKLMSQLDSKEYSNLKDIGNKARQIISESNIPSHIADSISESYKKLSENYGGQAAVAVRSSATAEDLPSASFAGQHESFLNISGSENLIKACLECYISLYTDRAIKYREDHGFEHDKVKLSIGVQLMVRSDLAFSGIAFTLDPESGFKEVIHISASWGLGENIVKGIVNPDEYYLYKPNIRNSKLALLSRKKGSKENMLINDENGTTISVDVPIEKRSQYVLNEETLNLLAKWCLEIESHYGIPMDIEWAFDGINKKLYIVQARPETIHSRRNPYLLHEFRLKSKAHSIAEGKAIGSSIAAGTARILSSPKDIDKLQKGDVLVTKITNPDWDPVMKKASALITDQGGRTSHASIVARELGLTAVVGTIDGTEKIKDGETITVSCSEGKNGKVYQGKLDWDVIDIDFSNMALPKTKAMMILGDPDQAYRLSFYPNNGIGLMRMEFIINNVIGVHPMALCQFDALKNEKDKIKIEELCIDYVDKTEFFIEKLSQAVGTIAAAFYPKDVIVRMSDFKTNEYANLLGGTQFEPEEENPMLGFRGASRYYNERYKAGFGLECKAMKRVREDMGLDNVKLMIPFCRTLEEGRKVIETMEEFGLKRGVNGLQIYVMAEIPSNVLLAEEFAKIFDGFSIGSNDLTQLTLGIDRDSAIISDLFNENNPAAIGMFSQVIRKAKKAGSIIGLCGQAPSDSPEFAEFLIKEGIDSISFNPDALIKGIENMVKAEGNQK